MERFLDLRGAPIFGAMVEARLADIVARGGSRLREFQAQSL